MSERNLSKAQFSGPVYHGSPEKMYAGDLIESAQARGVPFSGHDVGNPADHVYFTTDRDIASLSARVSGYNRYENPGDFTQHIYEVEPPSEYSVDQSYPSSYKSPHPLKIRREVDNGVSGRGQSGEG